MKPSVYIHATLRSYINVKFAALLSVWQPQDSGVGFLVAATNLRYNLSLSLLQFVVGLVILANVHELSCESI